ncbi:3-keto-disaccharide hydrolase [Tundrisphaera sp. TA3]|uniref:3-keto-disaccharide hydrolase n=1 Tax=Tundrisphaera sp. TA3 TaxID=3435775 RepID=UPI003EBEC51A
MNRRTLFLLALGLATLAPAPALLGDDEAGFVALFNGKDLSGWVTPDNKELFTVEDGEIVGRTKGDLKKNEFLASEKTYGDFVLKAKVKLLGGNSGIQFRSERKPDGVVAGPQADAAAGYWGLLYEERRRGILEQYPKELAAKLVHEGDWNDFVIEATGDHVVIHLNGTKVIDRIDPKFDKTGIIAFQVHVGKPMEVRFKDVKIKEVK